MTLPPRWIIAFHGGLSQEVGTSVAGLAGLAEAGSLDFACAVAEWWLWSLRNRVSRALHRRRSAKAPRQTPAASSYLENERNCLTGKVGCHEGVILL